MEKTAIQPKTLDEETLKARAQALRHQVQALTEFDETLVRHSHLLFECAGQNFALKLEATREIVGEPKITRIPGVIPAVAGVINVRGVILDVFDLRAFLGLPRNDEQLPLTAKRLVIVCEHDCNAFGLLIDRVLGIRSMLPDSIEEAPPSLRVGIKEHLDGVSRHGLETDDIVPIFDAKRIYSSPLFEALKDED